MSYLIKWNPRAFKFLDSLPRDNAERVLRKIDEVKENPFHYLEHYEGEYYKLRIGDYRLLIEVDFISHILWIQVFDKRGRIYKR